MKVRLVQYNPLYPRPSMLDSYNEIVESYHWGFAALGHDARRLVNHVEPGALNIVFGFQIPIQLGLLERFPDDTIFVNLERYAGPAEMRFAGTPIERLAQRYQIWDYSAANLPAWRSIETRFPVFLAPPAYAPSLEKIARDTPQDIDLLHYGKLFVGRTEALMRIGSAGTLQPDPSIVVLMNVWGAQRDTFVARSKIVLNVAGAANFEMVRVAFPLANRRAVVSELMPGSDAHEVLGDIPLALVPGEQLRETCLQLLADDTAREHYALRCYEAFRRRDVREVITRFLDSRQRG